MRGNVERMIHDAHKLSKDMQCRYVAKFCFYFLRAVTCDQELIEFVLRLTFSFILTPVSAVI
jgi:hypothetical protein